MKISVIIPTYNRVDFIIKAIESLEKQTYKPDEIIVIDDGSTDNTKDLIQDLDIRYIYQKNSGVSSARNRGIKEAKNQWIAFLDSDDVWLPNKLAKQVEFHKENRVLKISQTDEIWIRDGERVNKPKRYEKFYGDIFLRSLDVCSITPSSVLIHKEIFEDLGVFDEDLEVCEDYDLWLRISKKYSVGLVSKELIIKTGGHKDQLSFKHKAMDIFRVKALKKHYEIKEVRDLIDKKVDILYKGATKYNNTELLKELDEFRL